jgi:hypothetical protein
VFLFIFYKPPTEVGVTLAGSLFRRIAPYKSA